jgi:hypothetical protein
LEISSIVAGAVIAILIAIGIEFLRRPNLQIEIDAPQDAEYSDQYPAQKSRYLRVRLFNKPLPRWARWMLRSPALQCKGTINFHHLDGQSVFGRSMAVRWSGSPQPIPLEVITDDHRHFQIFDPLRLTLESRIDIYPGEDELLDVVARHNNEPECYGWNNEAYLQPAVWRTPAWRIPPGRYLIKIDLSSSGQKCSRVFRLINDVARADCRLELPQPNDPKL